MTRFTYYALLLLLQITWPAGFCLGQREVILKRIVTVSSPNPGYLLNSCDVALLVPGSRPGRQEVVSYTYSIKPSNAVKTKDFEYYIRWKALTVSDITQVNLEVSIKLKLTPYDLNTAKKRAIVDKQDCDTLPYLEDEENFRSKAKSVVELAGKLKGDNREALVKNIFDTVMGRLSYFIFVYQDRGAKQALKDGRGDCTEYSELMITLCRAKNIPARIVEGLILKGNGTIGYHNWVEVFFPQYGWVNFDPTWADHPTPSTTFYKMKNTYIRMSNKRYVQNMVSPCRSGDIPVSFKYRDTCIDLSGNMSKKMSDMFGYYNRNELAKAGSLLDTLLSYQPDNYLFSLFKGMVYARQGDFDKGLERLQLSLKYAETREERRQCFYAFANFCGLKGDGEDALRWLRGALDLGFDNYEHLYKDDDFEKIRSYPPFVELLNELKTKADDKAAAKKE